MHDEVTCPIFSGTSTCLFMNAVIKNWQDYTLEECSELWMAAQSKHCWSKIYLFYLKLIILVFLSCFNVLILKNNLKCI
jgi:hypothetical protein